MYLFGFAFRNELRHKLRTALVAAGIVVANVAFGLSRTTVDAGFALAAALLAA